MRISNSVNRSTSFFQAMEQVRLESKLEKGNTGQTRSSFETLKILNFLDSIQIYGIAW